MSSLATVLLDSYDNILLSPSFLKTWGPKNGYNVVGIAAYVFGDQVALCLSNGNNYYPNVGVEAWIDELTANDMGLFVNLELRANAPSVLGGLGGTEYANIIVNCLQALKAPAGCAACISNDAEVTDMGSVIEFYSNADTLIRSAGYEPAGYMQSSVYEALLSHGIEWLWHAPDGTQGPPWPKGTLIAQRPNFFVSPQGYGCDVDDVICTPWGGWNRNGLYPNSPIGKFDMVIFEYPKNAFYMQSGSGISHVPTPATKNQLLAVGVPNIGLIDAVTAQAWGVPGATSELVPPQL